MTQTTLANPEAKLVHHKKFFLLLCGIVILVIVNKSWTNVYDSIITAKENRFGNRYPSWRKTDKKNEADPNAGHLMPGGKVDAGNKNGSENVVRGLTEKLIQNEKTKLIFETSGNDSFKQKMMSSENKFVENPVNAEKQPYSNKFRTNVDVPVNAEKQSYSNKFRTNETGSANTDEISGDELQKLLKSELETVKTTGGDVLPETEVNLSFESIGKTVIIIGYHRTGSTLLGTTFQLNPGTFYIFEPFHIPEKADNLMFPNGTRIHEVRKSYTQIEAQLLRSLISCQFHQLPLELLMDKHHIAFKDSLEHTVYCMQRFTSVMVGKYAGFGVEKLRSMRNASAILKTLTSMCLEPVMEECRKSPVRVFKFIRLRMPRIVNVLRDTSDVSFIHLLRDPRGNVLSQARLLIPNVRTPPRSISYVKQFIRIAKLYCSNVRSDIAWKTKYLTRYANRLYTVQYETFAISPLEEAKLCYKFVDLTFPNVVEDFLWHLTMSGKTKKNCGYCVDRGNATISAFSWRKAISSTQLKIIDEFCTDVYGMMGLQKIQSLTDVRNMNIPLTV